MGSFRSPEARASDIAVLHSTKTEPRPQGPDVALSDLLEAGESITYRTRLPYSVGVAMVSKATRIKLDKRGRATEGAYDVGVAAHIKVTEGIVAWTMLDENGGLAPAWERERASELLDALRPALVNHLGRLIDAGSPPTLDTPVDEQGQPSGDDPDDPETMTEGEGSAGSSVTN